MLKYPNLAWHTMDRIVPGELARYYSALIIVNGNGYLWLLKVIGKGKSGKL